MRRSLRLARTGICRSGEYQVSLVDTIGCALPMAPDGIVWVTLLPCAFTPPMFCVPKSLATTSAEPCGPKRRLPSSVLPSGVVRAGGVLKARRIAVLVDEFRL